ncbi:hypothetical protein Glove_350g34 [Diversispora epigaea]|uniref:BTB domain-containing protein n=1 Tax=Diversispora epigaea TaxID=1348612 RepID=A0A397HI56_9GLOM|nr:hypothetical protein Glove_350g34 [Diversispora epigaea]
MTTKFLDRLSNDLTQLLEDPIDYNVPNNQIFKIHSYILQSRSPYFKKKFNETPFNDDHVKVLKPHDISVKVFDIIIKYIYDGIISLEKLKFAQFYQTSYQVKNFNKIQDFCNDIITKHPNTIFESENFLTLPEDALISIIKRDDLQLEESKVWEYVIRWGKAKNTILPTNIEEWKSDDFITLKQCLPHIRYFNISNIDVLDKLFRIYKFSKQNYG